MAKSKPAPAPAGVLIVGSLNMDLVLNTERMPTPGETVFGRDLQEVPGGKGANQAAAVGSLLPPSLPRARLIGRVGDDAFAAKLLAAAAGHNVDTSHILKTPNTASGVAMIIVDRHAENAIVVAPGANDRLTPDDLLAARPAFAQAAVLLLQLETPPDTVAAAAALAKQAGHATVTILDPAPAPSDGLPESLYHVDIMMPNKSEALALTGVKVQTAADAHKAAERILARGTRGVVLKMGPLGSAVTTRAPDGKITTTLVPGFKVKAVDTTAAGDCYNGALAVALAEGKTLPEAARFANAAGALACTKPGAQSSIPSRSEVEALIKKNG